MTHMVNIDWDWDFAVYGETKNECKVILADDEKNFQSYYRGD